MSIISTVYTVFERLAAAKLNLMTSEINSHNHDGTNGELVTTGLVTNTGDQTISGIKTFNSAPVLSLGANANNKQVTGLCIENRTDDTGCTQTGRIWIRTNV